MCGSNFYESDVTLLRVQLVAEGVFHTKEKIHPSPLIYPACLRDN